MRQKKQRGGIVDESWFDPSRREERAARRSRQRTSRSAREPTLTASASEESSQPAEGTEPLLKGRVISIFSDTISVQTEEKGVIYCRLRGSFKEKKTDQKNLLVVGDQVAILECREGGAQSDYLIEKIFPRRSHLSRADNLSRRQEQLIAANIDQVVIVSSLLSPPLKVEVIDRYLIAAYQGNLSPVIVINKFDLLDNSEEALREKDRLEEALAAYASAGIPCLAVSVTTGQGLSELQELLNLKTSVFSGQSGVGKSSLMNSLIGSNLPTRSVVKKTKKGAHTTTYAQLLSLPTGGWCIDTPGIRSFGLWEPTQDAIRAAFPEIIASGTNCPYSDCSHLFEQECAVRKAVEEGSLSSIRYLSYAAIVVQLSSRHRRR